VVTLLHPAPSGLSRLGRPVVSRGIKLATPAAIVLLLWLTGSVLGLGSLSFAEPDEPRFAETPSPSSARARPLPGCHSRSPGSAACC